MALPFLNCGRMRALENKKNIKLEEELLCHSFHTVAALFLLPYRVQAARDWAPKVSHRRVVKGK